MIFWVMTCLHCMKTDILGDDFLGDDVSVLISDIPFDHIFSDDIHDNDVIGNYISVMITSMK